MDNKSDQVLFKLGDLAKMLGVEISVLRFWEKEFKIKALQAGLNKKLYRPQELAQFKQVKHLLYEQRFTIAGAKSQLKNGPQPEVPKASENKGSNPSPGIKDDSPSPEALKTALEVIAETKQGLLEIKQMLRTHKDQDSAAPKHPAKGPAPEE